MSQMELIRKYFSSLEAFELGPEAAAELFHPEFRHTEFPNFITKQGQQRGAEACRKGLEKGRAFLEWQKIEIGNHFEQGAQVLVEGKWTGKTRVDAGPLKKGQVLTAHIAMIFELRDGKIFRQRNYDCYEPF